ncbi:MAG: molybdopterin cofactor-binding domain-containing protein [Ferruginibacter sp.]
MQSNFSNDNVPVVVENIGESSQRGDTERYILEYKLLAGLTYGVFVNSTIDNGRIQLIDSRNALTVEGVITILTHLNGPGVPGLTASEGDAHEFNSTQLPLPVFHDDKVYYNQQPVALVVATSYTKAVEAAGLLQITYQSLARETGMLPLRLRSLQPARTENYNRGSPGHPTPSYVTVETEYKTATNERVERHATLVVWDPLNKVSDFKKTPVVKLAQKDIANVFMVKDENVSVYSSFAGINKGFSSNLLPQEVAALLAVKRTGRPVTVIGSYCKASNRMDSGNNSMQRIELGAGVDGILTGITREAMIYTSSPDDHVIPLSDPVKSLYACDNVQISNKLFKVISGNNGNTDRLQESGGSFALESALDELSNTLMMDPLQLRLKNFAETDPSNAKRWSSNYLKECYVRGSESFRWHERNPLPAKMRSGDWLLGMGMSGGICCGDDTMALVGAAADGFPGNYSVKSFCAHFVEVMVRPDTGRIKVTRVVTAIDAGKIVNLQYAAGEVYNSIVRAIRRSLEYDVDEYHYGNYGNAITPGTHLSLKSTVPPIEVIFINKPDPFVGATGAKSIGEIGPMGFFAAVANAVFHATGRRVRSLPIRLDHLMQG